MSVTTLELGQAYLIAKFESYVFTCCGLGAVAWLVGRALPTDLVSVSLTRWYNSFMPSFVCMF